MALSGSTDLNYTRDELIQETLELLNVYAPGATIHADDYTTCSTTLNNMIKYWASKGIGIWKNRDTALFLEKDEYIYELGSTGDNASASYVKTEISTAAASGASDIVVDSITGISAADNIGIELDDGTLQWTTVNGAPGGSTVALDAVTTDTVAVDNHVYTYTTKITRPLLIPEARLHRADDSEYILEEMSRDEYMALANKTYTGPTNQFYYDRQLTNGKLYVWPAADDVQNWIIMTCRVQFEDFDASGDNPDFPQEWFVPITHNLAVMVAPKFKTSASRDVKELAIVSLEEAASFDKEYTSFKFGVKR